MKPDLIIFPSEPFSLNKPEPDFAEQVAAAREAGFSIGLVDTDEGSCRIPEEGRALYRGWYEALKQHTPRSVFFPGDQYDLKSLSDEFGMGPAIVKDYVKSAKHYWEEACFFDDYSSFESPSPSA